jgi:putative lysine transport system permease protein
MAEIIRGGIISVDKGQSDGAKSLGMTHLQSMIFVILPQAVRNVMPSVGNEFVVNIKDTSVLNVIGVAELYFQASSAAGTYSMFFESFCVAAVIYFVLTFIVSAILRYIEKKMAGKDTYRLIDDESEVSDHE